MYLFSGLHCRSLHVSAMNIRQSLSAAPCPIAVSLGQLVCLGVRLVTEQVLVLWLRAQYVHVLPIALQSAAKWPNHWHLRQHLGSASVFHIVTCLPSMYSPC